MNKFFVQNLTNSQGYMPCTHFCAKFDKFTRLYNSLVHIFVQNLTNSTAKLYTFLCKIWKIHIETYPCTHFLCKIWQIHKAIAFTHFCAKFDKSTSIVLYTIFVQNLTNSHGALYTLTFLGHIFRHILLKATHFCAKFDMYTRLKPYTLFFVHVHIFKQNLKSI